MSSGSREKDDSIRDRIIRQASSAIRKFSSPLGVPVPTTPAGPSQDPDNVKVQRRFQHTQGNILCYGSNGPNVAQISSPYIAIVQQNICGSPVGMTNVKERLGVQKETAMQSQETMMLEHCSRCSTKGIYLDGNFRKCLNCGMFTLIKNSSEPTLVPETFYNNATAIKQPAQTPNETRLSNNNDQWKSAKGAPTPVKNVPRRKRVKQKPKEKVCLTISSDEEDTGHAVSKANLGNEASKKEESESKVVLEKEDAECASKQNASPKYKIPKLSERMQPQSGTKDNDSRKAQESEQPNGYAAGPLLPPCSMEKQFELPVKSIHLGSLPGKCITSLTLQNNTLKVEVECTYDITEGNKKKVMNEKYKLALSSVEVAQINLNYDKEPLMISIIPSKRYSDIVNQALSRCVLDSQNEDPIKRQIVFFIECEQPLFRVLLQNNLVHLKRIAKVCVFSEPDCERLIDCLNESLEPSKAYKLRATVQNAKTRKNVKTMFVYPLPPLKGEIAITNADVECLMPGIYINDTIIDFYLKYMYEEKLTKMQQQRTYIFNSYFYTRLSKKAFVGSKEMQSPEERMHSQVRKWTRDINIFDKDFIIIPVNEHAHWFLVVICFPSEVVADDECSIGSPKGSTDYEDEVKVENQAEEKNEEKMDVDENSFSFSKADKSLSDTKDATVQEIGSESKESGQDTCSSEPKECASEPKDRVDNNEDKNSDCNKEDVSSFKQPCILIFDSLVSGGRSRVFSNLRHYLTLEWKEKVSGAAKSKVFTKNNIKGSFPKIPRQNNDCDCGIYILQFAESFFESPIVNYKFPIRKEAWFTKSHVDGKREDIKKLIFGMEKHFLEEKTNEVSKE